MSDDTTIAALVELSISLEKSAAEIYRWLELKFAHHQDVVDFWKRYAREEDGHARWLEQLRDRLSPGELSAPADPLMLNDARSLLQSLAGKLSGIKNLEDAYQLVNELENSETNAIFEFLITNFGTDKKTQNFLRSQLRDHIARLMIDFPTQFHNALARRNIEALD